jgi:hypothetical protein
MGWFWASVGGALAVVLGIAAAFDRRARRHGHRLRRSGDMQADVRQNRRRSRVMETSLLFGGGLNSFLAGRQRGTRADGRTD